MHESTELRIAIAISLLMIAPPVTAGPPLDIDDPAPIRIREARTRPGIAAMAGNDAPRHPVARDGREWNAVTLEPRVDEPESDWSAHFRPYVRSVRESRRGTSEETLR